MRVLKLLGSKTPESTVEVEDSIMEIIGGGHDHSQSNGGRLLRNNFKLRHLRSSLTSVGISSVIKSYARFCDSNYIVIFLYHACAALVQIRLY